METKEKIIGDARYRVTTLGGEESFFVQMRLVKAIAASVSSGRGIDMGLFSDKAKGFRVNPGEFFAALSDADAEYIRKAFMRKTAVWAEDVATLPDGQEIRHEPKGARLENVYDGHFGGRRQLDIWPWLAFCLEVNYGDGFFSEALGRVKSAMAESPSGSPPAPTGSSGGSPSPSG